MADYLIFRLYGPMAAWGDVAVGEYRPSQAHPGKSSILGLLAAALGIDREEDEIHALMAQAYAVSIAVCEPGLLLRDYHTAQVPPTRRKAVYRTRREELAADSLGTILSTRDYRTDCGYMVAVRIAEPAVAPFSLEELMQALLQPRFPLYLGRKSCPPALPLVPQIRSAKDLLAAFAAVEFTDDLQLGFQWSNPVAFYWEEGENAGTEPRKTFIRRDVPLSRRRWQFTDRSEHFAPREE